MKWLSQPGMKRPIVRIIELYDAALFQRQKNYLQNTDKIQATPNRQ
jgi:hypothetical protein